MKKAELANVKPTDDMETTVHTPIQCPNVLLLQEFVEQLTKTANRTVIRNAVQQLPRYPVVSLNDMNLLLQHWHCNTKMFKAPLPLLEQLEYPLLSFLKGTDEERYFVVIEGIRNGQIRYFSPYQGEVEEKAESFAAKWSGAMLRALPTLPDIEGAFADDDTEAVLRKNYINNHVRTYDGFLEPEACRYIIHYCEENGLFVRSEVEANEKDSYISTNRTSYSAGLKDRKDPVFKAILEKVGDHLLVPVNYIENLQCVKYSTGQQFKPHFDAGPANHRIHTMLVYLNDDFTGGETFFPELNLKIEPKQGRALYFLNRIDRSILLQSAHAGLPVEEGTKYGCNIWVRNQPAVA